MTRSTCTPYGWGFCWHRKKKKKIEATEAEEVKGEIRHTLPRGIWDCRLGILMKLSMKWWVLHEGLRLLELLGVDRRRGRILGRGGRGVGHGGLAEGPGVEEVL